VEVTVSEIHVQFDGSVKPVILKHATQTPNGGEASTGMCFQRVHLNEMAEKSRPSLVGEANLTFCPGQISVFDFSSILREAGEATAVSATFYIASELFDLEYVHTFGKKNSPGVWWGERSVRKRIVRNSPSSITVLPKPPKVELNFVGLEDQYYTNEEVVLQLQVTNGEDVDSVVTIVEIVIPALDLPLICDLAIKATYNLVTDLETPVYRSMSKQLEFINPFEANYDFSPRIHPDPWPGLFSHHEGESAEQDVVARGLAQKWCLAARYASFATDDLIIEDVDVEVLGVNGGIQCYTRKLTTVPDGGLRVAPKSLEEALFDTFTRKISLDDRGTATIDVSLAIKWHRDVENAPVNTSILAVPRLLVSSSEPRVLAAVSYSVKIPSMIHFDVTIENPSNHFLTFSVSMEPSEKFAFSGVKQSTLQLVPLSRRTMKFRLLPSVRGQWIGPIHCVIRDRYFQKVLKVAPTEGMKIDKDGILVWVPPEEDLET
jgi:hypothetical protein